VFTRRILCVDDNDDSCFLLANILHFQGYEAHSVQSAGDALFAREHTHFDLFILDVRLPDMSGYNLCRRIREIDQTTPIMFYSGDAFQEQRAAAHDAGANAYIVKPEIDDLILTVKRLLNTHGTVLRMPARLSS
jgi:CheY-like chemotaxis protein